MKPRYALGVLVTLSIVLGSTAFAGKDTKLVRFQEKLNQLTPSDGVDPLLLSELRLAWVGKPKVLESLIGEGFFSKCGDMSAIARKNYLKTLIDGARYDQPAEVAKAVRDSLVKSTGANEEAVKKNLCQVTGQTCHLYAGDGPVALNCD